MVGPAEISTGTEPVIKNVECNLCGSSRYKPVHTIPDFWMEQNEVKAIFVRCDDCGLIYQNPQPNEDEIKRSYPEAYRAAQRAHTFFHRYGIMKRAKLITRFKRQGILLDVGCGDGSFMQFMQQELHWIAVGIETGNEPELHREAPGERSQPLGEHLPKKKEGDSYERDIPLDIRYGKLEEVKLPTGSFDAVTLLDVLEHLQNPKGTLTEASRLLKPDGILVLRLPNTDSWDAQLFGRYWAGYDAPRHLFVFSPSTLSRMLEQAGLSVIEIRSDIGNYLNFVKSVQFWLTGQGSSPSMRKLILAALRSLPARVLAYPFNLLRDSGLRGSEMAIVAAKRQPE